MTNSTDSKELADNMPAKVQSSVNSAKKTLSLFVAAPEKFPSAAGGAKSRNRAHARKSDVLRRQGVAKSAPKSQQENIGPADSQTRIQTRVLSQLIEALGIRQTADLPTISSPSIQMPRIVRSSKMPRGSSSGPSPTQTPLSKNNDATISI